MNGLCAPSFISADNELALLLKERDRIDARIEIVTAKQNEETGINEKSMDKVVEFLIDISESQSDRETYRDLIENEWWGKSYNDIIMYINDYEMTEEPCIKKILKEHANHILLSK